MNDDLRYHLMNGPHSVNDLARLTGKSTSTIYKALSASDEVESKQGVVGKVFWLRPNSPGLVEDGQEPQSGAAPVPTPAPAADVAPAAANPARRGRKPSAQGQRLFPALLGKDDAAGAGTYLNPRRKGSHGYKSLQLIIDNPGITAEEFVAKGGRNVDLRWDLKAGNVRAES